MEETIRTALAAWSAGDCKPLVQLLGFTNVRQPRTTATRCTLGRSGSTAAVLLRCGEASAVDRARRTARRNAAWQHLFLIVPHSSVCLELLAFDALNRPRRLRIDNVSAPRVFEIDALQELVPAAGECGIALSLRHQRALDRSRIGDRFFSTFRQIRGLVSTSWTGIPAKHRRERDRLALLFLCRLVFLYFLQRTGHLAGRTDYFQQLRRRHARAVSRRRATFYRTTLLPLFHGVLNSRPERRSIRATRLGRVPYLNGGLFERDACERRFRHVDLADDIVDAVFDQLLDRFRFTSNERPLRDHDGNSDDAIDPEMLGRMFEGLMDHTERAQTGTFYTPSTLVDEVVGHGLAALTSGSTQTCFEEAARWVSEPATAPREFLEQLQELRVLDPACGSGAFLLGTLASIARIRRVAGVETNLASLVGSSLHGVDTQDDAALLCALRLWLTLLTDMGERVQPLPNLDRRIRQGDALLDPLDLYSARHVDRGALVQDSDFRARITRMSVAAQDYLHAEPESKAGMLRRLRTAEHALSLAWVSAQIKRIKVIEAELSEAASANDLFGAPAEGAATARRQLQLVTRQSAELHRLRARLRRRRNAPFFSFVVHFADAMQPGFDLVVSNPPWVRAHRWPKSTAALVRERYSTCDHPGWPYAARLVGASTNAGGQVDLAVLFLELAIRVLRPGGVVAMVLPAKLLRSLFAGSARRLLLDNTDIVWLEDRSLDRQSLFRADAFVATVVARKRAMGDVDHVATTVALHGRDTARYTVPGRCLPVIVGDNAAPWLLAPPPIAAILRTMQQAGPPIGEHAGLVIRRGVMTGANDVMVLREVAHRLSGLATVRAEGSNAMDDDFCAVVESRCVRPLVRGTDIRAWQCKPSRHVLWLYDEHLRLQTPPPFVERYLQRHRTKLSGRNPTTRPGALFRVSPHLLDTLVLWRDLAPRLEAVPVLPNGQIRPVPLNSVYFVATRESAEEALLLAAYLNSLPVRVFARTVAERAKNGYFRFFAWTVAVLPLPAAWRSAHSSALRGLAGEACDSGSMGSAAQLTLDRLISENYGIAPAELEQLRQFDDWLSARAS